MSSASSELSSHSFSKSHEVVRGFSWESFAKLVVVLDFLLFLIYMAFFTVYLFARYRYNRKEADDRKPILQIGYVVLRVFFGFSEKFQPSYEEYCNDEKKALYFAELGSKLATLMIIPLLVSIVKLISGFSAVKNGFAYSSLNKYFIITCTCNGYYIIQQL